MSSSRPIPSPDERSTFQTVSHHALTDLPRCGLLMGRMGFAYNPQIAYQLINR